ncbi:hypothetical protein Smp_076620 [Schistosoma mansoni]|uniref:hypothetical protein n=1 Tax=Schistosoma mansoni TaxID=6183 RepID=UPI0001A61DE0|nr:hypothetical protein Smp_076620 [Schistosoma mansoni]|eukprot:XP_018646968.1 hypothetical protein Smp_076620 [Schistosoma mansoni]
MDQGRLVSLDDNLLSQTVSSLRNVLAHDFDLPLNKQILLVSGGFQLEPGDKLSTYGAGLSIFPTFLKLLTVTCGVWKLILADHSAVCD